MNPNPANLQGWTSGPWWREALTTPGMLMCLAALAAGVLLLAACLAAMWRIGRRSRATRHGLLADRDGTAMMEFALVFPILLFAILLLSQTVLVMAGNLFVHYSAAAATRAAIVQIPGRGGGTIEAPNSLRAEPGNPKFDAIAKAARLAVLPVCGRSTGGSAEATQTADAVVDGLQRFYDAYGRPAPHWVTSGMLADMVRYAWNNTDIVVLSAAMDPQDPDQVTFTPLGGSAHTFGPRDPVTVRVEHKLYLGIPYVRALFASGRLSGDAGDGMYSLVRAQYTLTNEGVDPELPKAPALPRRDPG